MCPTSNRLPRLLRMRLVGYPSSAPQISASSDNLLHRHLPTSPPSQILDGRNEVQHKSQMSNMEPSDVDFDSPDRAAVAEAIHALNERIRPPEHWQLGNSPVTSCRHMRSSWFNPDLPDPATAPSRSSDISDVINAAAIPADDREVLLYIVAEYSRPAVEDEVPSKRSNAPLTFHRFRELPPELRDQIWCAALPARNLDFYHTYMYPGKYPATNLNTRLRVPILASVCKEARDTVLRHMQALGGYRYRSRSSRKVLEGGPFSYATDRDTLDLGYAGLKCFQSFTQDIPEFRKFRYFAFDLNQCHRQSATPDEYRLECREVLPLLSLPGSLEAKAVSVVVQTIHIGLKSINMALGLPVPPRREMKEIDVEATPFWLSAPYSLFDPGRFQPYVTHIVELDDRRGLQDVLRLAGREMWRTDISKTHPLAGCFTRFDAAFCMDCLLLWWEKRDKLWVQYLFLYCLWMKERGSPGREEARFSRRDGSGTLMDSTIGSSRD